MTKQEQLDAIAAERAKLQGILNTPKAKGSTRADGYLITKLAKLAEAEAKL